MTESPKNSSFEQKNALLDEWSTPFGLPPFHDVKPTDFMPAFLAAFDENDREIAEIIENPAPPSFANVIEALDRSGKMLRRVSATFFNLSATDGDDDLLAIEREIAPKITAHYDAISLNSALFEKVDALWNKRQTLGLSSEQDRLLYRFHTDFVRAGANLGEADKKSMREVNERLASLTTQFSQNVLADEADYLLLLDHEEDLAGLPDFAIAAAAKTASERGHEGQYAITLARSSIQPFLQFSERRDLREAAFKAWISRGARGGDTDNAALIQEIIQLRGERAKLMGFDNFADFKLQDTMAKTADAVNGLLRTVWEPARAQALKERDALQALVREEGANFDLAAWDWRYYTEKLRDKNYNLKEADVKPYLQLDKIIEAAFYTANRLFGLSFEGVADLPVYHDDVRVWSVKNSEGDFVGLFLGDYFARPSKRSGAWMSNFRSQNNLDEVVRPIVVNVMNFAKGGEGEPALLSFDDATTLFHEFGHGLHGLLSDVTYARLAGTRVSSDFVELPSQLYEHWVWQRDVIKRFAVHYQTGESLPDEILDRLLAARNFNQGFQTTEYLASAILDMDLHENQTGSDLDPAVFEEEALKKIGMPEEIVMRHRLPHFAHIFSGGSYAAGYYSYLWSEVLDADAFAAFEEAGDIFDKETAQRLHQEIYSAGNVKDPEEAYKAFRGRLPSADALLRKRGFLDDSASADGP